MGDGINERPWLRPNELAGMAGISVQSVRSAMRRGEIEFFRIGRQYFIPKEQFEKKGAHYGIIA